MQNYGREIRQLIKLATPVLLAQVAQTSMGFVDTVMAGGVSATDMAAVAVASSIWLPAILFGIGLLMALVPVVAQLNGAGQQKKVSFEVQQGFVLTLLISIPIMLLLYNAGWIVQWMNVEPQLADKTIGYMYAVVWAVPAFLLFQTLRSFAEGLSFTVPAMVIGFIGLLANIPLNWIFVYGKFGAPALGAVGCGVATALVYWLMFLSMLAYILISPRLKQFGLFAQWYKPDLKAVWRLFGLGFPVASALFFEVTLFAVVALLIAPLGSETVAAHQVALNFSSLVFMLPMSIATAVSIRVGHQLGTRSTFNAAVSARTGLLVGLGLAMLTALFTIIFRDPIIRLYTDDPQVFAMASNLMLMAAIYQCTDAIQVVAAGALRGYKDMQAIFERTFIAYWVLGLPIGYILGMTDWVVDAMGPYGFWTGIIIGLSSAAVLLGLRLHWLQRQDDNFQLAMSEK